MKTRKISIVLSIVTMFICCLFVSMQETEAQTTIECPEGHIYKCALIGDVTVYKGKGVTVIKPKEDK
jgi:hypothetical protein